MRHKKVKEPFLSVWCGKLWQYFDFLLGIVMLNVLILNWPDWDIPQRLICLLAILLPVHVFEEYLCPGGFYYMNNLGVVKEPLVYPQNRVTTMWTNLGAEFTMIALTFLAPQIPVQAVTVVIFFGVLETVGHTRGGILMYLRYRERGKKTIYGPGLVSTWLGLLEIGVYGVYWLSGHPFRWPEVWAGIGIAVGVIVFGILIPFAINFKVRSRTYAFRDKGYFEKYAQEADAAQ